MIFIVLRVNIVLARDGGGEKFVLCRYVVLSAPSGKHAAVKAHASVLIRLITFRACSAEREREKKNASRMKQIRSWRERYSRHHHFNSKRLPVLTLFIKRPITEHVLPWWIINYRSTSWAICS